MPKISAETAATTPLAAGDVTVGVQGGVTKKFTADLARGVLDQTATAANSITGTLTETTLATITIPAGAMGANGKIVVNADFTYTNSSNVKTLKVKLGGTVLWSSTPTTTTGIQLELTIRNRSAANAQRWSACHLLSSGTWGSTVGTAAIDTSASTTITITATLANTGETITLEGRDAALTAKV